MPTSPCLEGMRAWKKYVPNAPSSLPESLDEDCNCSSIFNCGMTKQGLAESNSSSSSRFHELPGISLVRQRRRSRPFYELRRLPPGALCL